ncbi:hypothetical protein HZU40_32200 [Mycolicibacterium fluoranthenivorans]|jgi:hypothetical protein|uniref:Transmembrane protein n=1 Tax=Mycolicibacterium fluoranthenivorans TaxID=258505 RepID=A0A1G4VJS4_9MYCO|nr:MULTISPECIES: hypothetical protein [Mycobacteriaceae]MCV7254103.1 hypothetical protein [Mycobacterium hackensackense]QNJ92719.1 hypothetical protein HZU40_32200 [Mycolicibacterium fluoranthenivorans]SCX07822.1 hypothetical protein SAMN02799620_01089 [Mycolicibacterium fluoranthenivorans]
MSSRYLPYATKPGRLLAQLLSDIAVIIWIVIWVMVGGAVYSAVATISEVGRQVQSGADGVSGNLASAGDSTDDVPLIGGTLAGPLKAASKAAGEIAGAGHSLDVTASWLAWVLAVAVAATPILAVTMPWLFLRLRFFRRKLVVLSLASSHAGQELLAMRALANRPLAKLTAIDPDPIGAWRRDDRMAIRGLALLELHAAGIRLKS